MGVCVCVCVRVCGEEGVSACECLTSPITAIFILRIHVTSFALLHSSDDKHSVETLARLFSELKLVIR